MGVKVKFGAFVFKINFNQYRYYDGRIIIELFHLENTKGISNIKFNSFVWGN